MIISLGFNCNISYLNQALHIKKETGLFEWFESKKLQYITDVINTLTINPESNIICENICENISTQIKKYTMEANKKTNPYLNDPTNTVYIKENESEHSKNSGKIYKR